MKARPSAPAGMLLVLPAVSAIAAFFVLPVAAGLLLSFTDFDIYALASWEYWRWIGWANYAHLLRDALFWRALVNTGYFVVVGGTLSILASLVAALLLTAHPIRARGVWRTALFVPVVTTVVAAAVVWRAWYHPRVGVLAAWFGALGIPPIDWLGDPRWAMPAIILFAVWKNFGFNMIIFVAALEAIPSVLYEAASVDGATRWQQFRWITLPMLRPAMGFVVLMTTIGYFQLFAEPYVMTQGGPANATLSLVLLMYRNGFQWWNVGYGAAVAWALFFLLLVITVLWTRWRALGMRG